MPNYPAHLDRRLLPRPLPAHLAGAQLLWSSSRAALTNLPSGLPLSNTAGDSLRALVAEIGHSDPEAVATALDQLLRERAKNFIAGLEAYRLHPYRRGDERATVRWRSGSARLLDYGEGGKPVLIVPSLINRYYILDLTEERSFARHLVAGGLRPLVVDWGEPGAFECDFDLTDYIAGPLEGALDAALNLNAGPLAVCGYCMGGLLALALTARRPADISHLALLATPWDFHAERTGQARLLGALVEWLPVLLGDRNTVPVTAIQSLFLALDPFLAERKFARFASLEPSSSTGISFVALEDWINDSVPLARRVALECGRSWYRDNDPANGSWQVDGRAIRPQELALPALAVLPGRDRIVPPRSAAPLAAALPRATVMRPPLGHIGMMSSQAAPATVWQPIVEWLRGQFA
jgi:polyhydroxyalkanoate synthase